MRSDASSIKTSDQHSTNTVTGMLFMIAAMILVPVMDAFAKLLATEFAVSPGQITFFRFFVQAVLIFSILAIWRPAPTMWPTHWVANCSRGALHASASLFFFTGVKYMPLADSMAIFFMAPLLLVLASAWILKEQVGWRRQLSVLIGFGGVLLVIRPNFTAFGFTAFLPLGAAALFTCYLLLTRRWAGRDHPLSMQLASGVGGSVIIAVVLAIGALLGVSDLQVSVPEASVAWIYILLIGCIAAVGHLLITIAFRHTEASILAPFQYIEIIVAATLGLLVFGEFPDALRWLGIAIIVAAGIYVFWRERAVAKAQQSLQ